MAWEVTNSVAIAIVVTRMAVRDTGNGLNSKPPRHRGHRGHPAQADIGLRAGNSIGGALDRLGGSHRKFLLGCTRTTRRKPQERKVWDSARARRRPANRVPLCPL